MNLIDLIVKNKLTEAKQVLFDRLNAIADNELSKFKVTVASNMFEEVEELDEALIDNWNSVVTNVDKISILGDFSSHKAQDKM